MPTMPVIQGPVPPTGEQSLGARRRRSPRRDRPPSVRRRRRRRWPWIVGVVVVALATVAVVFVVTTNRAHQVTMGQAEQRFGGSAGGTSGGSRPQPGVYRYSGSGTEHLTLPPLSQSEGPTMPGTVTLQGANCWVLRIDYSTHHWQTWEYCRHGNDLWEAGGQSWQLWSVGPIDVTNTSTFTCVARTMSLPAVAATGQVWEGRCTGTNTSVKGETVSAGPYRFVGTTTVEVGGRRVPAAQFLRLRTDSGAQRGSERSEVFLDEQTGLPLRLQQDIEVTTNTPFGTSTYTQHGVFELSSFDVHR